MPPTMPNWKVWPSAAQQRQTTASFMLHLFVHELSGLPVDGLRWSPGGELAVHVEWRGNRQKAETLLRGARLSSTSRRLPCPGNGVVIWEEGLSHPCRLRTPLVSNVPNSWLINLEIHGYGFRSYTVGKARIDAAAYAHAGGASLRVPVRCDVNGSMAIGKLTVTMEFMGVMGKEKPTRAVLQALSFSFQRRSSKESTTGSEEDAATTTTNGTLFSSSSSSNPTTTDESSEEFPATQVGKSPGTGGRWRPLSSLSFRRLSWRGSVRRRSSAFARDVVGGGGKREEEEEEEEGREVGRTNSLRVLMEREVEGRVVAAGGGSEEGEGAVVEEDDEVGSWQRRVVVSRDGRMEMATEVFFASIDQCSEKASGEGACTVLATLLADWLHRNKRTLPLRQELDEMIRRGSSEWRALCRESTHRRRFSDRHFDLETVLATKVRPLALDIPHSYVGFFPLEETPVGYVDQEMSFDSIFDKLLAATDDGEDHIYIASWNDHFFVLKMTRDAIYLIDTLGERLHEGCNQAFIIKFGEGSVIKRRAAPADEESGEAAVWSDEGSTTVTKAHGDVSSGGGGGEVVVSEGTFTCREYMKGFLAALPLREMRSEIERGAVMSHAEVHRRMQIEFHCTVPLPKAEPEISEEVNTKTSNYTYAPFG